jgi:Xaa-Pro aminopeptidase
MINIESVQASLKHLKIDGWLFADFHDREPIAQQVLGLSPKKMSTRRWFYLIPSEGEPQKIVHAIEPSRLDELPGKTTRYAGFEKLKTVLASVISGKKCLAMQYSPCGNLPSISLVDAGTVELIRSLGSDVVSSADLIQMFEARLTQEEIDSHIRASKTVDDILSAATKLINVRLQRKELVNEREVQKFILNEFDSRGLTCDNLFPIVAVNEHAADPHFEVSPDFSSPLKMGDRLLIDLWAKENNPSAIYYDITWCYQLGGVPNGEYVKLFNIARDARNAAKQLIIERTANGTTIQGWEVDNVARTIISSNGFGQYFTHRTGHSIHKSVHGNGANMDNFETHDDRKIIPGSCFSIEPGIYKSPIGVRTEINILVDLSGKVHCFGEEQKEIVII